MIDTYFKLFIFSIDEKDCNFRSNSKDDTIVSQENYKEKAIGNFLLESQKNLDQILQNEELGEILFCISSCFSLFPKYSLIYFDQFLIKSKINQNYIIITSSIIYELTHTDPKLDIPDFHFFVNDSLKEIEQQIKNNEDDKLTLFDHEISPEFKNTLILNLLLSSKLTHEIFINFFPYILSHYLYLNNSQFNSLLKDSLNSGLISMPDKIDEISQDLIEILINNEIKFKLNMNEKTLSFLIYVVYFTRNEFKMEFDELNAETILPFLAVTTIYIQKYEVKIQEMSQKITDLLLKGLEMINNDCTTLFKISINSILSALKSPLFSTDTSLSIILLFTQKMLENEFTDNVNELILSYLFDFSSTKADSVALKEFFNSNGKNIFKFVFGNIEKLNGLRLHKLNLCIFNNTIDIFINTDYFTKNGEFKITIYFLENYCYNVPILNYFNQILLNIIHEKIKEKDWDDVLLIFKFIQKNNSRINYTNLLSEFDNDSFPLHVKYILFNKELDSNSSIDELISSILNDPYPEKNKKVFQLLFDKMIEDEEILQNYLKYLICIRSNNFNLLSEFLRNFLDEFEKYQDIFMNIVNNHFFFDQNINALYKRDFIGLNSYSSPNCNSIISKLIESIEMKQGNFQAFLCLKNIASSFPFLFISDIQRVFNVILNSFENFSLIFDDNKKEEQVTMIKTSISSISFLIATLQSSLIFDKFLQWLFTSIESFTNSQAFVFILLLLVFFKNGHISFPVLIYVLKYNFIDTLQNLLEREFKEDFFKSQYINTICHLTSKMHRKMFKLTKYEIIQIEELIKIENPINFFYENIINSQPLLIDLQKIYLKRISDKIENFIRDITDPCKCWLSYNFQHNKRKLSSKYIYSFIDKLAKNKTEKNQLNLPVFNSTFSKKMIRYLVMKPSYVYHWFLFGEVTGFVPECKEIINKTNNELINQMNQDEETEDFEMFDMADFLSPHIKKLVKFMTSQRVDSRYLLIFTKLFESISNNPHALPLFINYTTQFFNEFSIENNGCESLPSLKIIHHFVDLNKLLSLNQNFKENLHFFFRYELISIALMPRWRKNSSFMMKTLYLVYDYKPHIMDQIIHLIGLIILNNSENVFIIFKFYDKLKKEQKEKLNHLILFKFDQEVEKEKINNNIINYYNKFTSLFMKHRTDVLYSLLINNDNYFTNRKDKDSINFLSTSFNHLAPKRDELPTTNDKTEISELIKSNSPQFWLLYEKYEKIIKNILKSRIMKLKKFHFFMEFPELLSFNLRSLYFRRKMKKRIKKKKPIIFEIDRENILDSSFGQIHHIEPSSLLGQITIQYKQEIGVDTGGLLRDWFTKLTREMFNPNFSLFSCSDKSKSYQPNINSNINTNHLHYFRFAGKILARALIEGVCIDTHLTTSFYKQILHCEPDLSDLEDVDEELYHSLQSLNENDVDSLCLTFTASEDEFGTCKTIPLKENGDLIDVKNENKDEYIRLLTNYKLKSSIEKQLNEFCLGFDSLIPNRDLRMFTPKEIDLLMCGVSIINVDDFRKNTEFIHPYNAETPVVKLFFETISKWNNEKLQSLLLFMTGSSRVPANGFKEFCEMSGQSLKIAPGGEKSMLPVARTCFNRIDLPLYETEEELNDKLLLAIKNCDSFDIK